MALEYLNFDVVIGRGKADRYSIQVNSSGGQATSTLHLPLSQPLRTLLGTMEESIQQLNSTRGLKQPGPLLETHLVREIGTLLFDALITGEIRGRYDVSQQMAQDRHMGLRIRLHIHDPFLAVWPWEYLYDTRARRFISLSNNTPISRYLDLAQPVKPLTISPPLRIIGMTAAPNDALPLDIAHEKYLVHEALQELEAAGLVELTWIEGQSWRDLQQESWRGKWHVFHFIGHGNFDVNLNEGVLSLVNNVGNTHSLSGSAFASILADLQSLRFVFLNACEGAKSSRFDLYSGIAPILTHHGIPAVLGMQYAITDSASIEFARTFYHALAHNIPVDAAVNEARKAVNIATSQTTEWGTPVLYMRSPDGTLFDLKSNSEINHTPTTNTAAPEKPPSGSSSPDTLRSNIPTNPPPPRGTLLLKYDIHSTWVGSVAWSPDGRHIASGGGDGTVHIWDSRNGQHLLTYRGHIGAFHGLFSHIYTVRWSPNGQCIASGGRSTTVQVWKTATGERILSFMYGLPKPFPSTADIFAIAWAHDGRFIASANLAFLKHEVQIWNATTGDKVLTYKGQSNSSSVVAWSLDDTRLASGDGNDIHIWNAAAGKTLLTYKGHNKQISDILWLPDTHSIASASYDTTVQVWNSETGAIITTYRGHTDDVQELALSPDGTHIASASYDKTVRIWNVQTSEHIFTYHGHTDRVSTVSWSPDGTRIASAGYDGTVHIWQAI